MVAQQRTNNGLLTLVDTTGADGHTTAAAREAGRKDLQFGNRVERLRPAGEAPASVGPMGTRMLEAGDTTVEEVAAARRGLEVPAPVVVDAGWLSRQLWRTVLGG